MAALDKELSDVFGVRRLMTDKLLSFSAYASDRLADSKEDAELLRRSDGEDDARDCRGFFLRLTFRFENLIHAFLTLVNLNVLRSSDNELLQLLLWLVRHHPKAILGNGLRKLEESLR